MAIVAFSAANDIADRFLQLLSDKKVHVPNMSSVEDELLSVTQFLEITKNPALLEKAAS